jgi:beta-ribofuranosylaminobenzene 5'-phosphate synthase
VICIRAFPRIHVSLIAMHFGGYRQNGGVGFAVKDPQLQIDVAASSDWKVVCSARDSIDPHVLSYVHARLIQAATEYDLKTFASVTVRSSEPSHSGLGSSTALVMAAVEGYLLLNGLAPERNELIRLSGRGGTSGVGIYTYFSGGLSLDFGRSTTAGSPFASSDDQISRARPLQVARTDLFVDSIGILLPKHIPRKSTLEEREFFERTCPLSKEATFETLYHSAMGVYAAAAERDYGKFCTALTNIQSCAWKSAEISLYGNDVWDCLNTVRECGADASGMSSLGPLVYFLARDQDRVCSLLAEKLPNWRVLTTTPQNAGRELIHA